MTDADPKGCRAVGQSQLVSFPPSWGFDVPVSEMVVVIVCVCTCARVCVAGACTRLMVFTLILTLQRSSPASSDLGLRALEWGRAHISSLAVWFQIPARQLSSCVTWASGCVSVPQFLQLSNTVI